MLFQSCIGLDIRNDRFNLVALKSGFRDTRLVAHTSIAYESQMPVADKISFIGQVVGETIKKKHLADADISLSLPRELFIVREIQLPLAVKENLRATLGYEMQKYVPLPLGDIYFDYLIVAENKPEDTLQILLVVIRRQDLDGYLLLQEYFGRQISGIELIPSATTGYLAAVLNGPFSGQSVGLIRSGDGNGDVCLYRRGRLAFCKHIQMAPDSHSRSTDTLISDLTAAVNSQFLPQQEINWLYYNDSGSPSLKDHLIGKLNLQLATLDNQAFGLSSADLIPACGLAIQSLQNRQPRINMLPPDLRRKPSRLGYYTMVALTILVLVLALSWGGSVVVRYRLASAQLDDTLKRLQKDVIQVEALTDNNNAMAQRLQKIDTLHQDRVSLLSILQELSSRVPLTAWIQEFNFKKGSVQISGYADSASELLEILETSPIFDDVVFLSAITRTKAGKEQFRIGMGIQ